MNTYGVLEPPQSVPEDLRVVARKIDFKTESMPLPLALPLLKRYLWNQLGNILKFKTLIRQVLSRRPSNLSDEIQSGEDSADDQVNF